MTGALRVDPMTGAELAGWIDVSRAGYAEQRSVLGGEDRAVSERVATEQYAEFFPGGRPAPGHTVLVGRDGASGERVGVLWLHEREDPPLMWVFDIEVEPEHRRRGWGRALMAYAEQRTAERGIPRLELNVFAGNLAARRLYSALGFAEASVRMTKSVGALPTMPAGRED